MATLRVKFKPCTAADEMTRNLCDLGLLRETQFKITESSDNVARFAIVNVHNDDAVKYSRKILMLPQVEGVEH